MKKIVRNMATPESRTFWETAERAAPEIQQWPVWKRAGINVAQVREPTSEDTRGDSNDDSGADRIRR